MKKLVITLFFAAMVLGIGMTNLNALTVDGTWDLYYNWHVGCPYYARTTVLTVYTNGTFTTSAGYNGTWVVVDGCQFNMSFDANMTKYFGSKVGKTMMGMMKMENSTVTGWWYAVKRPSGMQPVPVEPRNVIGGNDIPDQRLD